VRSAISSAITISHEQHYLYNTTPNSASSPTSGDLDRYLVHGSDRPHSGVAPREGDWEAEVDHAIAQGEAWALLHDQGQLGHTLPTPTLLRQWISMDHDEILRRLSSLFGGSPEDKFIQSQAESLIKRVISRSLPKLSKGFDAVVDIFVRHGRHLEFSRLVEEEACTSLAQQIGHGAAKTDLFIHNLSLRLCSQAIRQSPAEDAFNTNAVQEDGDKS
jgi:hypothetical protein